MRGVDDLGPSEPSVITLYRRADIAGLIEALASDDLDDVRANDARVALSLLGEPAVPFLLKEIARPRGRLGALTSFRCHRARIAVAGVGAPAVPYLLDAIRFGDVRLAEGAAECLESIEEGGVVLLDPERPTRPVAVAYPDDVRATYECKLGHSLPCRSVWASSFERRER